MSDTAILEETQELHKSFNRMEHNLKLFSFGQSRIVRPIAERRRPQQLPTTV